MAMAAAIVKPDRRLRNRLWSWLFTVAICIVNLHQRTQSPTLESPLVEHNQTDGGGHVNDPLFTSEKVESGWDDRAIQLYNRTLDELPQLGARNLTYWKFRHRGTFRVSNNQCGNHNFWEVASRGGWETDTFRIFEQYVNENETIVVDFGTWIGPTLIHHGSFSKRSIGIEADPVAYAVAEYNVELNKAHRSWGDRVTVDSGCVASPEDKGVLEMKAAKFPGASMSGIGEKVAKNVAAVWTVYCYTLPELFEEYWHIERPYHDVMIKIDVESYECKLIPSFYDWLKDEEHLPKMFMSFHPDIQYCTNEEYEGVLKFLRLYDHVLFDNKVEFGALRTATGEEFRKLIDSRKTVVIYQNHHAEKFPNRE
mmetsp:Transcript_24283/g.51512  ORF Transcript_24283/g.51512 Transcript_24283/m.51512 type:complete len:367 (+) Transcript_24283:135-1235(+)